VRTREADVTAGWRRDFPGRDRQAHRTGHTRSPVALRWVMSLGTWCAVGCASALVPRRAQGADSAYGQAAKSAGSGEGSKLGAMAASVDERLAQTFVELADTLVAGFDLMEFLHTLTERCVELLDVDAAGLLLADGRGALRLVAASTEQARVAELFQIQNDEGPLRGTASAAGRLSSLAISAPVTWPHGGHGSARPRSRWDLPGCMPSRCGCAIRSSAP
jgi:hypothetical protein